MTESKCLGLLIGFLLALPHCVSGSRCVNGAEQAVLPDATGQVVTFSQQPAEVGDRVAQTVGVDLQVNTTITQAGQLASQSQNTLKRRQQRFIEILEVVDGRVRRAHVTYPLSRVTSPDNADPGEEVAQPVEAKSYFVARAGKQLLVTDAEGAIPPQEEFAIVVTSLQYLGKPNPLVQFLIGREFRIGERLQLPQAIAEQLMGLGDQFSRVEEFGLELKSVKEVDGQPCAVFATTLEAVGSADNPVKVRAFGQMIIQTRTCRTVHTELSGPLTLSTAEQTPAGGFEYKAQGTMRIAVKSEYGRARQ